MVDLILSSLDDDKAQDVLAIDLVGKTSIADRMIVATGSSARTVSAMAEHLMSKLREIGVKTQSEGERYGDWVVIDAGDVIVHLFRPEVRTFYNIERIWAAPAPTEKSQPKAVRSARMLKKPAVKAEKKPRAKSSSKASAKSSPKAPAKAPARKPARKT